MLQSALPRSRPHLPPEDLNEVTHLIQARNVNIELQQPANTGVKLRDLGVAALTFLSLHLFRQWSQLIAKVVTCCHPLHTFMVGEHQVLKGHEV